MGERVSGGAHGLHRSCDKFVLRQCIYVQKIAYNKEDPPTKLNRFGITRHARDGIKTASREKPPCLASDGTTAKEELTIQSRGSVCGGKTYIRHSREFWWQLLAMDIVTLVNSTRHCEERSRFDERHSEAPWQRRMLASSVLMKGWLAHHLLQRLLVKLLP